MGAQGAPYSTVSESVAGGEQGARGSVLSDAQTRLMPDELDSAPHRDELTLTTSALEEATKLILSYEDCFADASGKVGWTDQATHSIDTIDTIGL